MKEFINKLDAFFGRIANWLIVIAILVILLAFTYKAILGRYMMYEDYYDNKVNSESSK